VSIETLRKHTRKKIKGGGKGVTERSEY
jgi:hypothetical protein